MENSYYFLLGKWILVVWIIYPVWIFPPSFVWTSFSTQAVESFQCFECIIPTTCVWNILSTCVWNTQHSSLFLIQIFWIYLIVEINCCICLEGSWLIFCQRKTLNWLDFFILLNKNLSVDICFIFLNKPWS